MISDNAVYLLRFPRLKTRHGPIRYAILLSRVSRLTTRLNAIIAFDPLLWFYMKLKSRAHANIRRG